MSDPSSSESEVPIVKVSLGSVCMGRWGEELEVL